MLDSSVLYTRLCHTQPGSGIVPPNSTHSHTVGMWGAAGTDPAQPSHASLCSLLPAAPTATYSCSNIPIPSLLPVFVPQDAWNPLAILPKAHHWLCPLDPCVHLCCCNNLCVGCRAVFPPLSRLLLLGKQPSHKKPWAMLCGGCVHPSRVLGRIIPSQGASEMQYFIRSPLNCSNR